ncbi:MAG: hypothetical protein ACLQLG_15620 [Thermoguttaceae bacterium]
MTEEQRHLCSLIGDLAQKAMAGGDIDAAQDRIDILVNQLLGPAACPTIGGVTGEAADAAMHN